MAWRVWGKGAPVVLLHGAFGDWSHWVRTIAPLARGRRVVVPDMPGFGESDPPADDHLPTSIPEALVAGLGDLLDAPAFDLVGFSFGSVMAAALAARVAEDARGPSLRRLVLVAPAGLGLVLPPVAGLRSLGPDMSPSEIAALHRHNLARVMFASAESIDDDALAIQMRNVARARVRGRRYSQSDLVVRAMTRIRARSLDAIWGEGDALALRAPGYEAAVAALSPAIRTQRIASAGHWVQYEAAAAFNAALLRILDETEGS